MIEIFKPNYVRYNSIGIYMVYMNLISKGYTIDVASYILDKYLIILYNNYKIAVQVYATLDKVLITRGEKKTPYYVFSHVKRNPSVDIHAFIVIGKELIGYLPAIGDGKYKYMFYLKEHEEYPKNLGQERRKIVKKLKAKGWRTKDIAKKVGLHEVHVRNICNNRFVEEKNENRYLEELSFKKALSYCLKTKKEVE